MEEITITLSVSEYNLLTEALTYQCEEACLWHGNTSNEAKSLSALRIKLHNQFVENVKLKGEKNVDY